jgi:hypothetical protein
VAALASYSVEQVDMLDLQRVAPWKHGTRVVQGNWWLPHLGTNMLLLAEHTSPPLVLPPPPHPPQHPPTVSPRPPHLLDCAVSPQHLAKAGVVPIQAGAGGNGDKELTAVGVL